MLETVQTINIKSDVDLSQYYVGRIVFFEMTPWETDSPKCNNTPKIMIGRIHAMRLNKITDATADDIICTINSIAFADTGSRFPGTIALAVSDLYTSQPELEQAKSNKTNAIKIKYRKEIQSVADLVRFMFDHDMSDKPDNYARQVAKEQATRLLDIKFETKNSD